MEQRIKVNLVESWDNPLGLYARETGSWKVGLQAWVRRNEVWRTVYRGIPASALVLMTNNNTPEGRVVGSSATRYNSSGSHWLLSTAASGSVGTTTGTNTVSMSSFGSSPSISTSTNSHSRTVRLRTFSSNGYYTATSSHAHSCTHTHANVTGSRYPRRIDCPAWTGVGYLPVGAFVFSRTPLSDSRLTEFNAGGTYDGYCVRTVSGNYAINSTLATATIGSGTLYTGYYTATITQDSWQTTGSWVYKHRHAFTHDHVVAFVGLRRRYRAYTVNTPIYDIDTLPSGSMIPSTDDADWPADWAPYLSGYLLELENGTTHATQNFGSTSQTPNNATDSTGGISTASSVNYQSEADYYRVLDHVHSIPTHTHSTAQTAYPLSIRVMFMEKA